MTCVESITHYQCAWTGNGGIATYEGAGDNEDLAVRYQDPVQDCGQHSQYLKEKTFTK